MSIKKLPLDLNSNLILFYGFSLYNNKVKSSCLKSDSYSKIKTRKDPALRDEDVYRVLQMVPPGQVTTYGDIARFLGHPKASRVIGRILNRNPNPVIVPCHRVIMSDGKLGGYAGGRDMKKKLLKKEGIKFSSNDVITEFNNSRFLLYDISFRR